MVRKLNADELASEGLEQDQGCYVRDLIEGLKLCDVCEDDAWLDFTAELEVRDIVDRVALAFGYGAVMASIRRVH